MSEKTAGRVLAILYLVGGALAIWLLQIHFRLALGTGTLAGSCSVLAIPGGSGCEDVAASRFSQLGFMPLAGIALGYYIAQLFMRLWVQMNPQASREPLYVSHALATGAVLVSAVMAGLSLFVVKSFCLGCAGLWLVNLLAWPISAIATTGKLGGLISANFEIFRPGKNPLQADRLRTGLIVSGVAVLLVAAFAGLVQHNESNRLTGGAQANDVIQRWDAAPAAILPPEALAGDRAKGAEPEAAVMTVVKFSDFQCPACQRAAQLFKPFYLRNKDRVRFVYRHFPLDGSCNPYAPNGGHFLACQTAKTSICAAKQGKFFPFHDFVMDNQALLSPAKLQEGIKSLGLDEAKLSNCLSSEEANTELSRDMSWADTVVLRSTPTFIVNGRRLEGGMTPDQWEALLREFTRRRQAR